MSRGARLRIPFASVSFPAFASAVSLALALAAAIVPSFALARDEMVTCEAPAAHRESGLRSCLVLPDPRGGPPDVLVVYFHGLTGNERDWRTYGLARQLHGALEKEGLRPAILSPSFGGFWLLKETPTPSGRPPLLPIVDQLIASTRARLPAGIPVVAVGASLGGYNALQFYFKRPDLFRAFVLAGPAVVDASPFGDPRSIVDDYVRRSRAWRLSAGTLVRVTRAEYLDEEDYLAHDPLILATRVAFQAPSASMATFGSAANPDARGNDASYPPLFLQVGAEDHFGFQLGSGILQRLLRLGGRPTEFALLSGGRVASDHVVLETGPAARFLARALGRR